MEKVKDIEILNSSCAIHLFFVISHIAFPLWCLYLKSYLHADYKSCNFWNIGDIINPSIFCPIWNKSQFQVIKWLVSISVLCHSKRFGMNIEFIKHLLYFAHKFQINIILIPAKGNNLISTCSATFFLSKEEVFMYLKLSILFWTSFSVS